MGDFAKRFWTKSLQNPGRVRNKAQIFFQRWGSCLIEWLPLETKLPDQNPLLRLHPLKITVWCDLWTGGVIGLYFLKDDPTITLLSMQSAIDPLLLIFLFFNEWGSCGRALFLSTWYHMPLSAHNQFIAVNVRWAHNLAKWVCTLSSTILWSHLWIIFCGDMYSR